MKLMTVSNALFVAGLAFAAAGVYTALPAGAEGLEIESPAAGQYREVLRPGEERTVQVVVQNHSHRPIRIVGIGEC